MAVILLVEFARRLARGEAGVDLIALLSIVAALLFQQTLVAAVIALMLASGRTLEFFTTQRAERELRALVDRAPRTAWLQEEGGLRQIPVEQIQPHQTILVRLGEVVPVDGCLLSAAAILDESALSGESLPVTHQEGELLPSGVSNVGAPFLLAATRTSAQSTYAGIVRLAEAARRSRAPFVRLADRYALYFIPLTLLIAAVAWQVSGDPLRALAVLVVATPCPLILAVPISIMSGISRAARRGILIKDGATLEALAGVKQVFLDKTGTLTSGHARLQSIEINGLGDPQRLLGLAASLAQASTHPISQAIVEAAHQRQLPLCVPQDVEENPGSGLCGRVDGVQVRFGTLSFADDDNPATEWASAMLRHMDYLACSGSFIDVDGKLAGLLVFSDNVRRETPQTLRRLRNRGIEKIVMLTGDRLETAQMIALSAGIDELRAGLTPEEKVRAVEQGCLRASTLMVGDGINDAPALAAANVGVAMGAGGATASAQAAGIVPLVDLKVELNGQSQSKQGLGDIIFGPALGFHHSEKLHSIVALDFIAPSGDYDRGDLANIGRNYWVVEPVVAVSYIDPNGLNVDVKTMYDFNLRNKATDYRSGQELHADYAVGWGLGNGWVVGVGGYILQQTTDDRQDGDRVEDNKGRTIAIGPSVKYTSEKGWFLTAKWEQETQVRNRAEGNAYRVKLTIPF